MKKIGTFLILVFLCFGFGHLDRLKSIAVKNQLSCADCSGTFLGCWGGEYSGDTDKMCLSSGTSSADGTASGATIDTWANHGVAGPTGGGTYGVKIDANDEYIRYSISSGIPINTSEGTLAIDVYLVSSLGTSTFATAENSATNYLRLHMINTNALRFYHKGNNVVVEVDSGSTVSDATWTRVYFAWSVTSNQIAVKVGAGAWTNDSDDDAVTALSAAADYFYIGDGPLGGDAGDTIYLDNLSISETYKDESI